jgi:hypothetical protein
MDFILAKFLRDHEHHDVWWYRLKITPKVPSNFVDNTLSPIDECPGEYALSKLLGITMQDLWEVLIACNCAKTFGKRGSVVVDKDALKNFITLHGLDHVVVLDKKKNQPHVDHSATLLRKSEKKRRVLSAMPPRTFATAGLQLKKFM